MPSSANILVVDDEASIRFFLEEMLTADGYQVVTADSAETALQRVAAQPFDLVLIDLNLPGLSGMDLITLLHRRWPEVVLIVLTAHASLETAVEALRLGAHDYLFKPSKTLELRASVQSGLLKRQQQLQQQALVAQLTARLQQATAPAELPDVIPPPANSIGAAETQARFIKRGCLVIDLLRHAMTLDGQVLELSPTEFSLLAYLASEHPKVISAKTLVRAVQGYETSSIEASDVLRYHIHRIRLKVRQATGRPDIIRTVRGVGYTLVET